MNADVRNQPLAIPMKKVAFLDFWSSFNPDFFPLKDICDIQITDMEHADYVFFSVHGDKHWKAPDRCIKIFYTLENLAPDFNSCDYAIGFEWLTCEDRYLRFPLFYLYKDICELMEAKHLQPLEKVMAMKTDFCSITVSNSNRDPIFKILFDALSCYKKVDSGGLWHNNVGGPVRDKLSFDSKHKFSIVCENTSHSGYTTEKLVQAFAANCIPIYWGDPSVNKVFNPKAFINVSDYASIDDLVTYIKKIDSDDKLYHQMLQEPALIDEQYCKQHQLDLLHQFLSNILTPPIESAYRRNRKMWGKIYVDNRRRQSNGLLFILNKKYHSWVWKTKQFVRRYIRF